MEEVWKDVKGYEGIYQISSFGNVKSLSNGKYKKERILKFKIGKNGRYRVNLCVNNIRKDSPVHQLVAIAFLNHTPCGQKIVVDHIDNNPLNNRVDNLQLISTRENYNKDRKKFLSSFCGVTWDKKAKKWYASIQINKKKHYLGRFEKEEDAGLAYKNKVESLKYCGF